MQNHEKRAFARVVYAVEELLFLSLDYKHRDRLRRARERLLAAISRKRYRTGQVKAALKTYLECLDECVQMHKDEHPPKAERPFVTEPQSEPTYPELVKLVGRVVVSNQFVLVGESGHKQSQISPQLKKADKEGFIEKQTAPTVFDAKVTEQIITLSGAGIAYCRKAAKGRVKPCEYDVEKGEHRHHLVTNIVGALENVKVHHRYYGTAKSAAVHCDVQGGRYQLPDLIGDLTHDRCAPAYDVPFEIECSLDIGRIRFKARGYLASEKDRVIVICLEEWMARKYKEDMHDNRRKLVSANSTETTFDFFYLQKVRADGKTQYRLVYVGGLTIGP